MSNTQNPNPNNQPSNNPTNNPINNTDVHAPYRRPQNEQPAQDYAPLYGQEQAYSDNNNQAYAMEGDQYNQNYDAYSDNQYYQGQKSYENANYGEQYQENAYQEQYNQQYDQPYDQPYNQEYSEPYEEQYAQPEGPARVKQQPFYKNRSKKRAEPEVVSTSQAINLTCTLAALFGLFGLFLYFADKRSNAVRRMSIQASFLTIGMLCASLIIWIVGTLFSFIPILGIVVVVICWLVFIALLIAFIYLKVQMMLHGYRGHAYILPFIGEHLRKYE